jgi:GGDEF domain-containing protein
MKRTVYLTKDRHNISLRASFGIAVFPDDSDTRTGLLALADKAMFHIKQTGKDSVGITNL